MFEWNVFASDWPAQWDDVAQQQCAASMTDIKYTTV